MRSKLLKGVTRQTITDTLSMAWPSVLEFVFLQLISMIDSVMVALHIEQVYVFTPAVVHVGCVVTSPVPHECV